jgi:DNA-binding SARP family transcriptional activator
MYRGETQVSQLPIHQAQRLLGYFLLHRGQAHSRSTLSSLFWGGSPEEQARKCLRTTLWRLRGFLEPQAGSKGTFLDTAGDEIGFSAHASCWLDVEEFEYLLAGLPPADAPQAGAAPAERDVLGALTRAVELYQGDLLEGWHDEWLLYERERLQGMFLNALRQLMDCHLRQGAYAEALSCGQRILSYDPLLEAVHRDMMRLHCLAGNRPLALRQYRLCHEILARELAIEPMEETTALYTRICESDAAATTGEQAHPGRPIPDARPPAGRPALPERATPRLAAYVEAACAELQLVQAEIEHLGPRFERAVQHLDTILQELHSASRLG